MNTPSQFKKTTPELVSKQVDETYNLEQAVAGQLMFILESQYAKDAEARAWEVDLRDHLKGLD